MPVDIEKWHKEQIENGYVPDENGYCHYTLKPKDGEQE